MRPESAHITPTVLCPEPELWSARDCESSEVEVGDFLFGLIRLLKPKVVIETGCYVGDTTIRMAEGLKKNGFGVLHTCDTDKERFAATTSRCKGLPVYYHLSTGVDMIRWIGAHIDLAFIDSNGDRLEECKALPPSYVVVHDMNSRNQWPIRELGWKEIFFPTPRGVSLFQKGITCSSLT